MLACLCVHCKNVSGPNETKGMEAIKQPDLPLCLQPDWQICCITNRDIRLCVIYNESCTSIDVKSSAQFCL